MCISPCNVTFLPGLFFTVHLRVSVEGVVYNEVFEADPNLTYRYAWQRKNAYQQNVYGIVTAHGKAGCYLITRR